MNVPRSLPWLVGLVCLSGLGSGCQTPAGSSLSSWQGIELKLVRLVDQGQTLPLPADLPITMQWDADGRVQGQGPVNRYFGAISRPSDGSILWQGALGSTRRAGSEDAMKLESDFFRSLTQTTEVKVTSESLTLRSENGQTVAEWVRLK
jgi:heat shock protein HslJ